MSSASRVIAASSRRISLRERTGERAGEFPIRAKNVGWSSPALSHVGTDLAGQRITATVPDSSVKTQPKRTRRHRAPVSDQGLAHGPLPPIQIRTLRERGYVVFDPKDGSVIRHTNQQNPSPRVHEPSYRLGDISL